MSSMIDHHAVLFSVDHPVVYEREEWNMIPPASQYRLPQLSIGDVRTLINDAHRRPDGAATTRTILVATEFITEEAQQALLKIIEEPPVSTRFIFVIKNGYTLLPTLESRFSRVAPAYDVARFAAFDEFKAASYKERITLLEDAVKKKDHSWQQEIKNGLMQYLKKEALRLPMATLKDLEYVLRHLLTRGASNKFLLEHLALLLPA